MEKDFLKNLPERFTTNIKAMPHFDGEKWLGELPLIIRSIEEKWSMRIERYFPDLSYNFVAPGISEDGERAVVKICFPAETTEFFDEVRCLREFGGRSAVRLLRVEEKLRAMLLERIRPGINLKQAFADKPEESVRVAVGLLKKLIQKPANETEFPKLDHWFSNFERKSKKLEIYEFRKAADILRELNSDRQFLLHGDFHHGNILASGRDSFLTIDPKGVYGSCGYDIAVFLNNHVFRLKEDRSKHLKNAVELFSEEFRMPFGQIRTWAYAQQVLASYWSLDDGAKNWREQLGFAGIWERI